MQKEQGFKIEKEAGTANLTRLDTPVRKATKKVQNGIGQRICMALDDFGVFEALSPR